MKTRGAGYVARRVFGWLMLVPLAVAGLAIVVGAIGVWWLRTPGGNEWIRTTALAQLQPPAGTMDAAVLRTDLFSTLEIDGFSLRNAEGKVLVAVEHAGATYAAGSLLGRTLPVSTLTIDGLVLDVESIAELSALWGPPAENAAPWNGIPLAIEIEIATLTGSVRMGQWAAEELAVNGGVTIAGTRVAWKKVTVSSELQGVSANLDTSGAWQPGVVLVESARASLGPNRMEAAGALRGNALAFQVASLHVERESLLTFIPELSKVPVAGAVDCEATLTGTTTAPELALTLSTAGGPLVVDGRVDLNTEVWDFTASTPGLALGALMENLEPIGTFGRVKAQGVGFVWPDGLRAEVEVELGAQARDEIVQVFGPLLVEHGVVRSTAPLRIDAGWATGLSSMEVDVPGQHGSFKLASAQISLAGLARYGVAGLHGRATFEGDVDAAWRDAPTANVVGSVGVYDLAAAGAEVAAINGPLSLRWDRSLAGAGTLSVADVNYLGRHATSGTLAFALGQTAKFDLLLSEPDREIISVEGDFTPQSGSLALRRLHAELVPGTVLTGQGEQRVTIRDGGIAETAVSLRVGATALDVRGGLRSTGSDTLVVELSSLDLSLLSRVVPGQLDGWSGLASARLGVVGNLHGFETEGDASFSGLVVPEQVEQLSGRIAWQGGSASLNATGSVADGSAEIARFTLGLPLGLSQQGPSWRRTAPLAGSVVVPTRHLRTLAAVLPGVNFPDLETSAELKLSGSLDAPVLAVIASANVPIIEGGPTVRTWLDATLEGGELYVRAVVNQAFQSRLELNLGVAVQTAPAVDWLTGRSRAPTRDELLGQMGGAVVLKQLPIATLRRLFDLSYDVDGALSGAFALSGRPWNPRIEGGIDILAARVGRMNLQPAKLSITPFGPSYQVEASFGFLQPERTKTTSRGAAARWEKAAPPAAACSGSDGSAGSIRVAGFVPLDDWLKGEKSGLHLDISGDGVPLSVVEALSPNIVDAGGCLLLAGTISGSLSAPELALGAALTNAGFAILPLGVRYDDVGLRGRFQGNILAIDSLHAENGPMYGGHELRELDAGRGKIDGAAQVEFDGIRPAKIEGKLDLDGAWLVATSDRRGQGSGTLIAKGTPAALAVTGNLVVDNAYMNISERFFTGARGSPLHPDLEIIRPGAEVALVEQGELSPFTLDIRPKVTVDLARHVRVRAAMPLQGAYGDVARSLSTVEVEAALDGQLTVSHRSGRLSVSGEVVPEDARATILGRPFTVSEGTVAFTGVDFKDPLLDIEATYTSAEYGDIDVAIGGSARDPSLAFRSDELGEDDILAVLVLGAPISELGKSDGGGDAASAQALAIVTGVLRSELEEGLSSTFRLESVEIDDGLSVSIALGRNVFLTTQYNIVDDMASENMFEVAVEVTLPYRWYLEVGTGDKGISRVSALRKWRF